MNDIEKIEKQIKKTQSELKITEDSIKNLREKQDSLRKLLLEQVKKQRILAKKEK